MYGIIQALAAAKKEEFFEVVLISNSFNAIQALNGVEGQLNWTNLSWLDLINCSLQNFSSSTCVYLPRSHIAYADSLASFGSFWSM